MYATLAPFGFLALILLLSTGFLSRLFQPVLSLVYSVVFEGIG
jgi:hypothetical protein